MTFSENIARDNDTCRFDDNSGSFSCVMKATPLHIIDHGSVLYLILKILLYNQQYVYDFLENNNDGNELFSAINVATVYFAAAIANTA